MKIILDAMGGDNAPEAVVLGALDAAKDFNTEIILVGRGEDILDAMKKNGVSDLPAGVAIAHADDVVDMHDDPAAVLHKRKNSSMVVGLKMLAEGQGDAFVSAGSTGALLTAATLVVKRVKGIRRAAMAPAFPNKAGSKTIICDCGANAEFTPYIADRISWALVLMEAFSAEGLGFGTAFAAIPELLSLGMIEAFDYWKDLIVLYLFVILGAFSTVRGKFRKE